MLRCLAWLKQIKISLDVDSKLCMQTELHLSVIEKIQVEEVLHRLKGGMIHRKSIGVWGIREGQGNTLLKVDDDIVEEAVQ